MNFDSIRDDQLNDYLEELEQDEFECTECSNLVEQEGTQCCGACFETSMR